MHGSASYRPSWSGGWRYWRGGRDSNAGEETHGEAGNEPDRARAAAADSTVLAANLDRSPGSTTAAGAQPIEDLDVLDVLRMTIDEPAAVVDLAAERAKRRAAR